MDAVNTASPATWWVSVDHLNRPVKMTSSTKAAVWTAVWQPWGAAQSITGSATLNARFPGQWFQVEAGLHYNWHRHYDPSLGRYTQPDPLGFVDGPSVYGYVAGNPHSYVDRDGRLIWLIPRLVISFCERNAAACQLLLKEGLKKAACLLTDFVNDERGGPPRDGQTSEYTKLPRDTPNSVDNRKTDVTRSEFERVLRENGYKRESSKDGKATNYTKSDGTKYSVRPDRSGKPTADFYRPGSKQPDLKIRLRPE